MDQNSCFPVTPAAGAVNAGADSYLLPPVLGSWILKSCEAVEITPVTKRSIARSGEYGVLDAAELC